jgi:acetyl esterase/lipase
MSDPTGKPGRAAPARRTLFRAATAVAALCTVTALLANAMPDASAAPAASAAKPAATGTPVPGSYDTHTGLAYVPGGTSKQTLNLYVPRGVKGPIPVIMYVHGGGWGAGSAAELPGLSGWQTFLDKGFALASIEYTLTNTALFPQQIYDVKAAIRFLRASAPKYRLSGKIGLWGGSAGGQLVALAGTTCGVTPLEGKQGSTRESSCVQAVFDMVGPTDFSQLDDHLLTPNSLKHNPPTSAESKYLGCTQGLPACPASTVQRANPITYLTTSSKLPPFLIVHGDADNLVPHWASKILFEALTSVCADATFYTLHGQDHFFAQVGALDPPYPTQVKQSTRNCSPVASTDGPPLNWDVIAAFFATHLR